jgi:hypothetical protein
MTGHQRRPMGPHHDPERGVSRPDRLLRLVRGRPVPPGHRLDRAERSRASHVAPGRQEVAERIRVATQRSHALGNYLPPPRCPAQRQDRSTLYICCRWDPHPADHGTDDEGHRWVPVEP